MKEEEEDNDLEREAVEELLKEAKRGKIRSETMGAMGWMKCPLASTNKRFLVNTIKNTLPTSKPKDQSRASEEKKTEDHQQEKRQSRTHKTHPYERSRDSQRDDRSRDSQRDKSRSSQGKGKKEEKEQSPHNQR
uniref:Uncharacterized protein n=1 Tax=Leptobrachium leishanense TaxID=445787 RepID=A0A8C5PQH0_9ANUR